MRSKSVILDQAAVPSKHNDCRTHRLKGTVESNLEKKWLLHSTTSPRFHVARPLDQNITHAGSDPQALKLS